jgi:hypothetical protein
LRNIFELSKIWSSILQKLSPVRVGKITVQQADDEETELIKECDRIPAREGCLRGILTPLYEKQAYFKPYEEEAVYYTHQAYAEWAGAVVEVEFETDTSFEVLGTKGFRDYPVKGWAYRVFIRNTSDGVLFELPEPEEIPQSKPGDCRCPFCLGAKEVLF